jgi:uncharacterized BrkB/YihY/UPF0761 family membrane protein
MESVYQKTPSKGMAIASMILGIISLVAPGLNFITGLVAVILGSIAVHQGKGTDWDGRGMAIAGVVTGTISIILYLLLICLFFGGCAAGCTGCSAIGAAAGS